MQTHHTVGGVWPYFPINYRAQISFVYFQIGAWFLYDSSHRSEIIVIRLL